MTEFVFPEFRDQQLASKYPFADGASLVESTGLSLDPAMLIDAAIYPIGLSAGGQITQINITPRTAQIIIGDKLSKNLASVAFDTLNAPTELMLQDAYGRPAGMLLCDPLLLASLATWSAGTHIFASGAAEFVASLCIPSPQPALDGLLTALNELLTDDVWLVGDRGVVLREDNGSIRVDIVGDPLFTRRLCSPLDLFVTPKFVKTINGTLRPDVYGEFALTVGTHLTHDTILRIYPDNGGLRIEAVGPVNKG